MNSVNAFVRTTIDDLIQKRLWPVAAGLLIALIAIPVLLSNPANEEPGPVSAPVAPAVGAGGSLSAFQPAVNTEGKKSSEIRKDLEGFKSKDPFKPQNVGGGGGTPTGGSVEVQGGEASTGGGSTDASVADAPPLGTSGGGLSGDGDGSSTDTSGGTTTPEAFYYTYTADVRFGKEGNLDRKTLSQFRSLPSSEDPVVVFMGVREDGETAIFLLSSAATSTGEGNCEPDDTCTFLYMKKGDEQRLEAVNANDEIVTYELVLLDIDVKRTDGPEKATSSSRGERSKRSAHSSRKTRSARRIEKAQARNRAFGFQAIGF
jgi:hypothetical protein